MDENMSPEIISKVLWRHDPASTGCNVCEDMEDEYDRIAQAIADLPNQPPTFDAFRAVLAVSFFEEDLSDDAMRKSYREIYELCGQ